MNSVQRNVCIAISSSKKTTRKQSDQPILVMHGALHVSQSKRENGEMEQTMSQSRKQQNDPIHGCVCCSPAENYSPAQEVIVTQMFSCHFIQTVIPFYEEKEHRYKRDLSPIRNVNAHFSHIIGRNKGEAIRSGVRGVSSRG